MTISPYNFKEVPKTDYYTVAPQNITLDFSEGGMGEGIFMKIHDVAKVLAEHIDIISESRELVRRGETITWEELLTKYARKKTK